MTARARRGNALRAKGRLRDRAWCIGGGAQHRGARRALEDDRDALADSCHARGLALRPTAKPCEVALRTVGLGRDDHPRAVGLTRTPTPASRDRHRLHWTRDWGYRFAEIDTRLRSVGQKISGPKGRTPFSPSLSRCPVVLARGADRRLEERRAAAVFGRPVDHRIDAHEEAVVVVHQHRGDAGARHRDRLPIVAEPNQQPAPVRPRPDRVAGAIGAQGVLDAVLERFGGVDDDVHIEGYGRPRADVNDFVPPIVRAHSHAS